MTPRRFERVARKRLLISQFPNFLRKFEENPPFNRTGQLECHAQAIQMRRELGSVTKAVQDDRFLSMLHETLKAWGIGSRASRLKPLDKFVAIVRSKASELASLDGLGIEDMALDAHTFGQQLWQIIDDLEIVSNSARVVSGSKALHHLLPDLVVPIDRAYTQKFFLWRNPEFQYHQAECFMHTFCTFAEIARHVRPAKYVGCGWNTSPTKVIDNALIGMVMDKTRS